MKILILPQQGEIATSLNLFVLKASMKTKNKVECRLLLDVVLRDDAFADKDLLTSTKINDEERMRPTLGCLLSKICSKTIHKEQGGV